MNLPKVLTVFRSHICRQKIQKIIPLVTPLLTLITFTSIVPFSLNSSHLQHILSWITHFHIYFHPLVSLKFHYFFTIFILTSKTELQSSHKIFKNTYYPLRRSKMPLKSILSLRQQSYQKIFQIHSMYKLEAHIIYISLSIFHL